MGMTLRRSRLDSAQTLRLLEHFVAGTTARTAAELVGVNRNTATHFYHRLRQLIAARLTHADATDAAGKEAGNEIYLYGAGKAGTIRAKANDRPVFALTASGRRIRALIVPAIHQVTLLALLQISNRQPPTVFTDDADVSFALRSIGLRHHPIGDRDRFSPGSEHVNTMENFWNQTRRNLRKYNGIPRHHLHLYLKECEWRFNYGSPRELRTTLTRWVSEDL